MAMKMSFTLRAFTSPSAGLVASEGADQGTDHAQHRTDEQRCTAGNSNASARQRSGHDSRDQTWRRGSWRSLGQQIGDVLDECQHGEDCHSNRRSHEGQRRAFKVQPSQVSRPTHQGGSGQGTQSGNDSYAECKNHDIHPRIPCDLICAKTGLLNLEFGLSREKKGFLYSGIACEMPAIAAYHVPMRSTTPVRTCSPCCALMGSTGGIHERVY